MFVNGIFRRHNSSRALTIRDKEIALWREKARTTADSDWPSGAPTQLNLRQRAQARGMMRSQGRVARRAAWQICRKREKEGMRKCAKGNEFFRRFAQREATKPTCFLAFSVTVASNKINVLPRSSQQTRNLKERESIAWAHNVSSRYSCPQSYRL